ncbi:MAG: phage integrase N-terminal SAM-like domain-containing protein [Magnetococcales bacterium]|nr:phage integrase N-terminal SAM-like domain-containing protein [Magnetococcales bacterium]
MNTLRQRMINDLSRTGLSARSQQVYLHVVDRLAARSWRSLEDLSEQEVQDYLFGHSR